LKLERPYVRVFLGFCDPADLPAKQVVRGVVGAVEETPFLTADMETELRPHGFARFEVALGITALNQGPVRRSFRT